MLTYKFEFEREVGIAHLLIDQGVEIVRNDTIRRLVRNPTILDNVNNLTQGTEVFAFTREYFDGLLAYLTRTITQPEVVD